MALLKKHLPGLAIALLLSSLLAAQSKSYTDLVDSASAQYKIQEYRSSAELYAQAFRANGDSGLVPDRYNAACSWALAGEGDSAFVQLFRIAEKGGYDKLYHLLHDPDLNSLHQDERWKEVIELVQENKAAAEAHLNRDLVAELDSIYEADQKYRQQVAKIREEYGWQSKEMNELWRLMRYHDSVNLHKVEAFITQHGWLGSGEIGDRGNATLFYVIQHADLATQEHYLPLMRKAVAEGRAQGRQLALLEDRVALGQGKKQIYGSQLMTNNKTGETYVQPILEPEKVNERRAAVGLNTIEEYVAQFGIVWNLEQQRQKWEELESAD